MAVQVAGGCTDVGVTSSNASKVLVTPAAVTLEAIGASVQLAAGVYDQSGTPIHGATVSWTSLHPQVAWVDASSGRVTAAAVGTARIAARVAHLADTADVVVQGSPLTVWIFPGENIQEKVNGYPPGTEFLIKSGVHRRQSVRPKDGNRFIGEPGAVLDGENVTPYAFETVHHHPRNVEIRGLIIEGYAPPRQRSAIQGDNGVDWLVEDNVIRHNAEHGLRLGNGMRVRRNHIHGNGLLGVGGFRVRDVTIEGNEIAYNNPTNVTEPGATAEAAGIKVLEGYDLIVRDNFVHHNNGKGIWTDHQRLNTLVEANRVADNRDAGIWHENSYGAIIRDNVVERNGAGGTVWLEKAGITVTNSPGVRVYGNTVSDNANGIGVMQAAGYASGPYGPNVVENLHVHDNVIRMERGRTGLAQNTGDTSIYTSRNNRFEGNTYCLGPDAYHFLWAEQNLTPAGWQNVGNDENGVFREWPCED